MEKVQFEEPSIQIVSRPVSQRGMVGFLIKNGYAQDEGEANKILLGIIVICCLFVVVYWVVRNRGNDTPLPDFYTQRQFLPPQ